MSIKGALKARIEALTADWLSAADIHERNGSRSNLLVAALLREKAAEATALLVGEEPPAPLKSLRAAWEAGFRLCRGYGDNHAHFDGDQKERQWRAFLDEAKIAVGEEPPADQGEVRLTEAETARLIELSDRYRRGYGDISELVALHERAHLSILYTAASPRVGAPTDEKRIEDYRSGYSCGFDDAKCGQPMRDLEKARLFFGLTDQSPAVQRAMAHFHEKLAEHKAAESRVGAEPSPETQTRTK